MKSANVAGKIGIVKWAVWYMLLSNFCKLDCAKCVIIFAHFEAADEGGCPLEACSCWPVLTVGRWTPESKIKNPPIY
jgi:hypothetical protein